MRSCFESKDLYGHLKNRWMLEYEIPVIWGLVVTILLFIVVVVIDFSVVVKVGMNESVVEWHAFTSLQWTVGNSIVRTSCTWYKFWFWMSIFFSGRVMLIGIFFDFFVLLRLIQCNSSCYCTFLVAHHEVDTLLVPSQIGFGSKKDTVYCRCCDNFDNDN